MRIILVAAVGTLAFFGIADARMYKCADPNGKVTYSERPCEQGTQNTIKLYDNAFDPPAPPAQVDTNDGLRPGTAGMSSGSRLGGQAGAQSRGSSSKTGTTVHARKGMSMAEVRANLGKPDTEDDPTLFHGNTQCRDGEQRDVWMYHGSKGYLGQKITFCNSEVVQVASLTADSKHAAPLGSNKTGHVGGSLTAQRGWSRTQVLERMGQPDSKKPMAFSGNHLCPAGRRVDTFVYASRGGNLGQTVIFCDDAVIDVTR